MKIKPTETFPDIFWAYNYPVCLWKDDNGDVIFTGYSPRREACFDGDVIPKEELGDFIDSSISKFEIAIKLFKQFKAGKIDNVYYWDED